MKLHFATYLEKTEFSGLLIVLDNWKRILLLMVGLSCFVLLAAVISSKYEFLSPKLNFFLHLNVFVLSLKFARLCCHVSSFAALTVSK